MCKNDFGQCLVILHEEGESNRTGGSCIFLFWEASEGANVFDSGKVSLICFRKQRIF